MGGFAALAETDAETPADRPTYDDPLRIGGVHSSKIKDFFLKTRRQAMIKMRVLRKLGFSNGHGDVKPPRVRQTRLSARGTSHGILLGCRTLSVWQAPTFDWHGTPFDLEHRVLASLRGQR